MTILGTLRHGRPSALRKVDIARIVGCSTRDVEHEIERARKAGEVAICSDSVVGYWLPETAREYADNLQTRRRRALNQLVTNRGERRALRRIEETRDLTLGLDDAA